MDEAYYHFCGQTVIDLVGQVPNLIVARTFSKAYGLAGLRLGMLAAPAGMQQWLRTVISPYSVNSLALACLPAALDDDAVPAVVCRRSKGGADGDGGEPAPARRSPMAHARPTSSW